MIQGVNVGDHVKVYYNGRPDFPMTGNVVRNDANMCVVQRDDVAPAKQYVRLNPTIKEAECKVVPHDITIFGDNHDARLPRVVVERI